MSPGRDHYDDYTINNNLLIDYTSRKNQSVSLGQTSVGCVQPGPGHTWARL